MMRRDNAIYFLTAVTALIAVALAGYFLVRSAQPSADVLARYDADHPLIRIADFASGEAQTIMVQQLPIIVWRRDASDIALVREQNDQMQRQPSLSIRSGEDELQPEPKANSTVDQEWLVA